VAETKVRQIAVAFTVKQEPADNWPYEQLCYHLAPQLLWPELITVMLSSARPDGPRVWLGGPRIRSDGTLGQFIDTGIHGDRAPWVLELVRAERHKLGLTPETTGVAW
jgi:hypothetical protein